MADACPAEIQGSQLPHTGLPIKAASKTHRAHDASSPAASACGTLRAHPLPAPRRKVHSLHPAPLHPFYTQQQHFPLPRSYFPCTPQWYLERSELLWCPQGVDAAYAAVPALRGAQVLLPEDRVTEATLEGEQTRALTLGTVYGQELDHGVMACCVQDSCSDAT